MAIRLLSDEVVRKIAAGEVIERPANVIKELVENSVDSSATAIHIEVVAGGTESILVKDNGNGIAAQDLPQTVIPHATSKLAYFEDLNDLTSFGFRGEALASVSAVSKFCIRSRTRTASEGLELQIFHEKHLKGKPSLVAMDAPVGTLVRVDELFYNVPARRNFLRRQATEYGYILEVVQAFSLVYPDIHWTLKHNGKMTFESKKVVIDDNTPESDFSLLRTKAQEIFSLPRKDMFLEVAASNPYISLRALITPPGIDFANSKRMFTFANKRWLKDKSLNALILRGYQTHLLKGRYPGCVVMLTCDPSLCDINIHPAKKEIKFQYQKEVGSLIVGALQKVLRSASWVEEELPPYERVQTEPLVGATSSSSSRTSTRYPSGALSFSPPNSSSFSSKSSHDRSSHDRSLSEDEASLAHLAGAREHTALSSVGSVGSAGQMTFPSSDDNASYMDGGTEGSISALSDLASEIKEVIPWKQLHYMGSFAALYLVFEDVRNERLLFVDQHGFHERILFEKLMKDPKYVLEQGKQRLLMEQPLSLSPSTLGKVQDNAKELHALGFGFSVRDGVLYLQEIPTLLMKRSIEDVFEALADHPLPTSTKDTAAWMLEDILATIACHSAIRAGETLSSQDLKWLISQAESVDFYHNCPHGRRVFCFVTKKAVSRWFDRL